MTRPDIAAFRKVRLYYSPLRFGLVSVVLDVLEFEIAMAVQEHYRRWTEAKII